MQSTKQLPCLEAPPGSFLLPRPYLGLELSASASPRPRRLLLEYA